MRFPCHQHTTMIANKWLDIDCNELISMLCQKQIETFCFNTTGCNNPYCGHIHLSFIGGLPRPLCRFYHSNLKMGCTNLNCRFFHLSVREIIEHGSINNKRLLDFNTHDIDTYVRNFNNVKNADSYINI